MSKEGLKKIGTEVSKECMKKLKISAIQKEVTLAELVREILERYSSKKNLEGETV